MNPAANVDVSENTPRIPVTAGRLTGRVLGSHIDTLTWETALGRIFLWARARTSHYVCMCNVHGVVSTAAVNGLRKAINGADMAAPDGKPVAVPFALQGFRGQPRISGPELMWKCCEQAAQSGVGIFLYRSIWRRINDSGAGLVFVGLGCPKQELWMAEHKGRIQAIMLGVRAAFDFHSGRIKRASDWMQELGLEWLSRLAREPRRLWRRYRVTNLIFLTYILLRTPKWILSRRGNR